MSGVKFGVDVNDWSVPADYDGDGKDDIAVWRRYEGDWYILKSSGGVVIVRWGLQNDIPLTRAKYSAAIRRKRRGVSPFFVLKEICKPGASKGLEKLTKI
jgi:hypothetical protein